nr:MAG TPA: hypothetical protein [Caudoviricetes sp.]
MKRENQLLENKKMREEVVGRIEVLEQVGELLLLPNTDFATKEMVSQYYGIKLKTLESCIEDNQNEIQNNGMRLYKRAEILNLLKGGIENNEIKVPNRGLILFSKRAILNVGMLLRDSKIAKELRSRLLDIIHDSEQGQGNIETIINEISEEKQLMLQRIEAEMNGNFDEVCVINAKLFALKNKRISELEDEIKIITENSLTIKEARKVINRLVRIIAMKEFSGAFGKAYSELYSKVNYQLGINIKARNKKSNQSYIEVLTEEETFSVEKIVRTWANNIGIDVEKELKIS